MIHISGRTYALIHENRNGWNFEAFKERYSEVLERYDYVIGDWGYNQLRLKGFFRDGNPKATRESVISSMADYINEYCNFGCAYFVLEKQPGSSKLGEDGETGEDGELRAVELPDSAEEAYLTASRVIAAAKASDAPAAENQHVKFMPRHERDLRREQQRNSRRETAKEPEKEKDGQRENRKPNGKDRDQGNRQGQQGGRGQGQQHDRGERPERERGERQNRGERTERGDKHDRGDKQERGERQERGEQNRGEQRGDRPERGERPERSERSRNKQRHFNPNQQHQKAPVAAASEPGHHHQQPHKAKDASPKQS